MMKVIWIVMLFLLIFLSFIAYIFIERGKDVSIDTYHSPIKEGNEIIEALEMYKNKNETYPVSLDELTPDYIYEIPIANWGTNFWEYDNILENNKQLFILNIKRRKNNYEGYIYESKYGKWYYDQ